MIPASRPAIDFRKYFPGFARPRNARRPILIAVRRPIEHSDFKLDARVAEHVMGWVRNRHDRLWPDRGEYGFRHSRGHGFIPAYSDDASTAVEEVLTALAAKKIRLECLSQRPELDGNFECTLIKQPGKSKAAALLFKAVAPTAARAICLAALKAVEEAQPGKRSRPAATKPQASARKKTAAKKSSRQSKKNAG